MAVQEPPPRGSPGPVHQPIRLLLARDDKPVPLPALLSCPGGGGRRWRTPRPRQQLPPQAKAWMVLGAGGAGVSPKASPQLLPRLASSPRSHAWLILLRSWWYCSWAGPLSSSGPSPSCAQPWGADARLLESLHVPRAASGAWHFQAGLSLRREGRPPSRGPPGRPAFGCSSWPGRWLEGQARIAAERRLPSLQPHTRGHQTEASPGLAHPRPP